MPSAFDNKVICFIVTTTTFAILKLSMIIKHQKTSGKQKKQKTIFQESQKPWKKIGDSWVDPLSPKTLGFFFVFVSPRFFQCFFLVLVTFGHPRKKEKLDSLEGGGGPAQTLRILFLLFFSKFFLVFRSVYRIRRDQLSYSASRTPSHL